MEPRKRISLLLAIVSVCSMLVVIASTLGSATDDTDSHWFYKPC